MTVVARRIAASPERLPTKTWTAISQLVCRDDAMAAAEFKAVEGAAACLIADEALSEHPLVVKGTGPRLRVYCLYGEAAVGGDDKNEATLSWKPTDGDWTAFLPCAEEDHEAISKLVEAASKKFRVYVKEKGLPDEDDSKSTAATGGLTVDWGAVLPK